MPYVYCHTQPSAVLRPAFGTGCGSGKRGGRVVELGKARRGGLYTKQPRVKIKGKEGKDVLGNA